MLYVRLKSLCQFNRQKVPQIDLKREYNLRIIQIKPNTEARKILSKITIPYSSFDLF